MSKLNRLLRAAFCTALENVPVVGKVFQVLRRMEEDSQFEGLSRVLGANSVGLSAVILSIDNIEKRIDDLTGAVAELKQFNHNNDFVMLPRLLHQDPAFEQFWLKPQEFGGCREHLSSAMKRPDCFSFLMSDMCGDKWVYHIPVFTFGLLLQNRALKGESTEKAIGYDKESETSWITENTNIFNLTVPENRDNQELAAIVNSHSADIIAIKRSSDGRYEVSPEGVITDTKTGLHWYVGPDRDTTWNEADAWVKNLNVAGGGWHLPTLDELDGIYEKNKGNKYAHIDEVFWHRRAFFWIWSTQRDSSSAWVLYFRYGNRSWRRRERSGRNRSFAVRYISR